jgi:molybdenum cofactor cytidylyltransferase
VAGVVENAVIVLAAGLSSRMAGGNKLLMRDVGGWPLVGRVAYAAVRSGAARVVVVTGHDADAVEAAVRAAVPAAPLSFVRAADFTSGMAASLRAGVAAAAACHAVVICLGDMPLVTFDVIAGLFAAHAAPGGAGIVVPAYCGQRGNPVLWGRRYFEALAGLSGDQGARGLLRANAADVAEVAVNNDGILRDFDTAASLSEVGWASA